MSESAEERWRRMAKTACPHDADLPGPRRWMTMTDCCLCGPSEIRAAESTRDQEWSSALESGYSDSPPSLPEDIPRWLLCLREEIRRSVKAAILEEITSTTEIDFTALRNIILSCNEQVDKDGGCECTRKIAALIERNRAAESAARAEGIRIGQERMRERTVGVIETYYTGHDYIVTDATVKSIREEVLDLEVEDE